MSATPLCDRLIRRIALYGPITVADYMAACLGDPDHGYYTTAAEPFGRAGDFITAPEVSQMFGELIGAWTVAAWQAMGAPASVRLVELGPGRGTLMADLLRTAALRPDFLAAATLHLVETSPRLGAVQAKTLAGAALAPIWHDRLDDVPDGPLLLVANEFFDALPIHQYVRTPTGWRERCVGLSEEGSLAFGIGVARLPDTAIPGTARAAPDGAILETAPMAAGIARRIGARLKAQGGAALIVDYGHMHTAPGDTLQALRRHAHDDVLASPGVADLTAHVDFESLAQAARDGGAHSFGPLEQGDFLLRLGLLERAGALGAGKSPDVQERIRADVERLAAPERMGSLFKVLALTDGRFVPVPFDSR
ncbi:class I SAM-dependent methyltransferase [Polymorphum gilvum]|uniref:ATP synthase beta subunit/transription termination factor rho n=1 Tax=Polymorphum gilvum (strain LMG 25793 / CGMCC 1.9160 / SL003B-26A1) TaxID=991905 RepID=F2J0F6_POLGS|nr:class I SAM-dependent methyltransferase [Polymorphum gilvum]ADZ69624.1 ATP synthase beta subunit/transription termination factor rho [Polymorphum gilvum SL003B-26A1]